VVALVVLLPLAVSLRLTVAAGEFEHEFNVGEGGDSPYVPRDLAVSPDDRLLFVVDGNTSRVYVMDTQSAAVLTSFGGRGTGDGEFWDPQGVAVSRTGNALLAYVTDGMGAPAYRIQRFECRSESSCRFVSWWGGSGLTKGFFLGLRGLTSDGTGDVYVPDYTGLGWVQKFSPEGVFKQWFGAPSPNPEDIVDRELSFPIDIEVDAQGDVWVAESEPNHQVAHYTAQGVRRSPVGCSPGNCPAELYYPSGLGVGPDGLLYVQDIDQTEASRFLKCLRPVGQSASPCGPPLRLGRTMPGYKEKQDVRGVDLDSAGRLYAVDDVGGQILFNAQPAAGLAAVTSFWKRDPDAPYLASPRAVSLRGDTLLVSDNAGGRIVMYRLGGSGPEFVRSLRTPGGEAAAPAGTALTDGLLYVADPASKRVWRLNREGRPMPPHLGDGGAGPAPKGPWDVEVNRFGDVYVLDRDGFQVLMYNRQGEFVGAFGSLGQGPGKFSSQPISIAVGPDNLVYVLELGTCRIDIFTRTGEFRRVWGAQCTRPGDLEAGKFHRPTAVSADERYIYVLEQKASDEFVRVQVFDDGLKLHKVFAERFGVAPSRLWQPVDVSVNEDGRAALLDESALRVSIWSGWRAAVQPTVTVPSTPTATHEPVTSTPTPPSPTSTESAVTATHTQQPATTTLAATLTQPIDSTPTPTLMLPATPSPTVGGTAQGAACERYCVYLPIAYNRS
jgi:DNA-binding beta-propeller fold protein YncE